MTDQTDRGATPAEGEGRGARASAEGPGGTGSDKGSGENLWGKLLPGLIVGLIGLVFGGIFYYLNFVATVANSARSDIVNILKDFDKKLVDRDALASTQQLEIDRLEARVRFIIQQLEPDQREVLCEEEEGVYNSNGYCTFTNGRPSFKVR